MMRRKTIIIGLIAVILVVSQPDRVSCAIPVHDYLKYIQDRLSHIAKMKKLKFLESSRNPLNDAAYDKYLPLIKSNNPGVVIEHDPRLIKAQPPTPSIKQYTMKSVIIVIATVFCSSIIILLISFYIFIKLISFQRLRKNQ